MGRMPDFLVIGAAKAGTTSLYFYLRQHPQIYMPSLKEPHFFAFGEEGKRPDFRGPGDDLGINSFAVTDLDRYLELFQKAGEHVVAGEASTQYLYSNVAPVRIKHYVPNVKLIAVLRNPVERAFSAFLHQRREGREPFEDFRKALEAEEERIKKKWDWLWHYKSGGFYAEQLERYFMLFEKEQMRIYLYEDLKSNPLGVVQDIFAFLGVDPFFRPNFSLRYNVSGIPRNRWLHVFLSRPNLLKRLLKPLIPELLRQRIVVTLQNRNLVKPEMPEDVRRELIEVYREDVLKLQDLIGRDLSHWLR